MFSNLPQFSAFERVSFLRLFIVGPISCPFLILFLLFSDSEHFADFGDFLTEGVHPGKIILYEFV